MSVFSLVKREPGKQLHVLFPVFASNIMGAIYKHENKQEYELKVRENYWQINAFQYFESNKKCQSLK